MSTPHNAYHGGTMSNNNPAIAAARLREAIADAPAPDARQRRRLAETYRTMKPAEREKLDHWLQVRDSDPALFATLAAGNPTLRMIVASFEAQRAAHEAAPAPEPQ